MNIQIDNVLIGPQQKPFVVAEMSANHNSSLQRAKDIITAAAMAGANAIKLQTFTASSMTLKGAMKIMDTSSLWYGKDLYDLYSQACTPLEWHQELFDTAKQLGLIIFSTPFDEPAVDFLETLQVPAYKIASFENTDHPLLIKVAKTCKPIIMSTGAASLAQIAESVQILRNNGCRDLILLKCTSSYPSNCENSNLNTIPVLQNVFNCPVGLSDHTLGIGAAIAAVALGACIIEKHFTLSDDDGGLDSAFSVNPTTMQSLVQEVKNAYSALGNIQIDVHPSEKNNLLYKRSIYAIKDIQEGEIFTIDNIKVLRPALGLEPKFFATVLGMIAKANIKTGTPIAWGHF